MPQVGPYARCKFTQGAQANAGADAQTKAGPRARESVAARTGDGICRSGQHGLCPGTSRCMCANNSKHIQRTCLSSSRCAQDLVSTKERSAARKCGHVSRSSLQADAIHTPWVGYRLRISHSGRPSGRAGGKTVACGWSGCHHR